MPTRHVFAVSVLLVFGAISFAQGTTPPSDAHKTEVPVRVDARVELLSIVFRLAGANEYSQAPRMAAYVKEVDAQFTPFREHEAIKLAQRLRRERGISYDAVASFALHLRGGPILEAKIAFDPLPLELDRRWSSETATQFLAALQRFADDSKAFIFFEQHRDFYQRAADRLAREVARRPYRLWLDGFFGAKPGAQFCAVVGLLNGGSNYGCKVRHADGREEISPIIGASRFDSEGLPVYGPGSSGLVAHEFCHAYCNPLVDQFADKLLPAALPIFERRAVMMRQQAYGNPRTMLYESLVRASTHRFLVRHGTAREAASQLRQEVARGFLWTPELSALLGEYEASRDKYPTLADFMPRVVEFFKQVAADVETRLARLPHVVRMTPKNGTKDVDSATTELLIEFDRPMNTRGHSLVGNPSDVPEIIGTPGYGEDGKTFRCKIKLAPGKSYRFSLNSINFSGFSSAEGMPLDPVAVTFTTKGP